jgi:hypothetical protein
MKPKMKRTLGVLCGLVAVLFAVGLGGSDAHAAQAAKGVKVRTSGRTKPTRIAPGKRIVYPSRTELDFEGIRIEGELRNPGEFYFQYRPEEKFDSLVKRRRNFHREMLRDVVLTK